MIKSIIYSCTTIIMAAVVCTVARPVMAEGTIMFNYQGRVKVQGETFSGNGQFKFVIVSPDGKSTLWSNDSNSVNGLEPINAITLPVTDGVFNTLIGDPAVMDPINSTVFQTKQALKLRTWFNDGINGFQELKPDHNLVNTTLITLETSKEDFTIFVDGQSGNDSNSGLKPQQAKKTIQAAVDIVPARVLANVSIEIANGIYEEEVKLVGINAYPGSKLRLIGDEERSPASSTTPAVVITGADGPTTGVRNKALYAINCTGIEIAGIGFTDSKQGVLLEQGNYELNNCFTWNNGGNGLTAGAQSATTIRDHLSTGNITHGIAVVANARALLYSCKSFENGHSGLAAISNSAVNLYDSGEFSNNRFHGILCVESSVVQCFNPYSGAVSGNKEYGIVAGWYSYFSNFLANNTISGNTKGSQLLFSGGQSNW